MVIFVDVDEHLDSVHNELLTLRGEIVVGWCIPVIRHTYARWQLSHNKVLCYC